MWCGRCSRGSVPGRERVDQCEAVPVRVGRYGVEGPGRDLEGEGRAVRRAKPSRASRSNWIVTGSRKTGMDVSSHCRRTACTTPWTEAPARRRTGPGCRHGPVRPPVSSWLHQPPGCASDARTASASARAGRSWSREPCRRSGSLPPRPGTPPSPRRWHRCRVPGSAAHRHARPLRATSNPLRGGGTTSPSPPRPLPGRTTSPGTR